MVAHEVASGRREAQEHDQEDTPDSFTVLDFIEAMKELYSEDWKSLTNRFGQFGQKRR
jgi:hypothetical protein